MPLFFIGLPQKILLFQKKTVSLQPAIFFVKSSCINMVIQTKKAVLSNISNVFFIGIGGIGMSALARFFSSRGYAVGGYDKTPSLITHALEQEGIQITYTEDIQSVEEKFLNKQHTIIVRTPAVPLEQKQYVYFSENGFTILKRSEVLGLLTEQMQALCVAGTHGKTTTSTILAHIMHQSEIGCNAFLGGLSLNYNSNLLIDNNSQFVVVEADEYDRSFHHLRPYMSVITSVDPDHLDIYGDEDGFREGFAHYTSLIQPGGSLIIKKGIPFTPRLANNVKLYTYSSSESADFYADNVVIRDGNIVFDFHTPSEIIASVQLGVPAYVNIENSVAAMAVAWLNGVSPYELRSGLASYSGVYRRFNVHVKNDKVVYIDDYAHHPTEILNSIKSVRTIYPNKTLTGIFQPHLYSRTRDFADEFAKVLSSLDRVILLPIYPARELPIKGVSSQMLLDKIHCKEKKLVEKQDLVSEIKHIDGVVMTIGAGDIDRLVEEITKAFKG